MFIPRLIFALVVASPIPIRKPNRFKVLPILLAHVGDPFIPFGLYCGWLLPVGAGRAVNRKPVHFIERIVVQVRRHFWFVSALGDCHKVIQLQVISVEIFDLSVVPGLAPQELLAAWSGSACLGFPSIDPFGFLTLIWREEVRRHIRLYLSLSCCPGCVMVSTSIILSITCPYRYHRTWHDRQYDHVHYSSSQ